MILEFNFTQFIYNVLIFIFILHKSLFENIITRLIYNNTMKIRGNYCNITCRQTLNLSPYFHKLF